MQIALLEERPKRGEGQGISLNVPHSGLSSKYAYCILLDYRIDLLDFSPPAPTNLDQTNKHITGKMV